MNELDDSSSNDVFGIHDALVTVVISFVRRFVLEFVDLRVVYVNMILALTVLLLKWGHDPILTHENDWLLYCLLYFSVD